VLVVEARRRDDSPPPTSVVELSAGCGGTGRDGPPERIARHANVQLTGRLNLCGIQAIDPSCKAAARLRIAMMIRVAWPGDALTSLPKLVEALNASSTGCSARDRRCDDIVSTACAGAQSLYWSVERPRSLPRNQKAPRRRQVIEIDQGGPRTHAAIEPGHLHRRTFASRTGSLIRHAARIAGARHTARAVHFQGERRALQAVPRPTGFGAPK